MKEVFSKCENYSRYGRVLWVLMALEEIHMTSLTLKEKSTHIYIYNLIDKWWRCQDYFIIKNSDV
jgi:hypothetical protein